MSPNRKASLPFALAAAGLFVIAGVAFGGVLRGPWNFADSISFLGTLPETPMLVFALVVTPIIAAICAIVLWRLPSDASRARNVIIFGCAVVLVVLFIMHAYMVVVIFGAPVAAFIFSGHRSRA
jgi:uncharacterized membrane protein